MAIKAIIFDCFGVLVLSGRESLQHDYPHLRQELHDLTVRSDYGFLSRADFDKELAGLTGIPLDEVESKYWAKNVRNESVFEWVRALKKEGQFKIGLLSNIGPEWLDDFIPVTERNELFDEEVLSGTVGITKPDQRIFQLAADRLGVDTLECVMIDDLLENIRSASSIGMQGIVFDTTERSKLELTTILERENA